MRWTHLSLRISEDSCNRGSCCNLTRGTCRGEASCAPARRLGHSRRGSKDLLLCWTFCRHFPASVHAMPLDRHESRVPRPASIKAVVYLSFTPGSYIHKFTVRPAYSPAKREAGPSRSPPRIGCLLLTLRLVFQWLEGSRRWKATGAHEQGPLAACRWERRSEAWGRCVPSQA